MLPQKPLLLVLSLLAASALACSLGGGAPTAAPTQAPPTAAPAASETPAAASATQAATAFPTAAAQPGGAPAGYSLAVPAPSGSEDRFGKYASLVLDDHDDPIIAFVSDDPNADNDFSDSVLQVVSWDRTAGKWTAPVTVAKVNDDNPSFYAYQLSLAR